MPDLTRGIVESGTNSYVTPTPQIRDTWGGIAGIKMWSKTIVHSKTLFYAEKFVRISDLFANRSQGGSCNPMNWHLKTGVMDETVVTVVA